MTDWVQWQEAGRLMGMAPGELRRLLDEDGAPVIDRGSRSWQIEREHLMSWKRDRENRRRSRSRIVADRVRTRALPGFLRRPSA